MPLFSDLSNISHYYSGGSSTHNYLAGPYAGHSSIVAANYRAPPPSFSKPTTRIYNRGYKPHLATISENQMTRSGLSRINSPKLLYHSSPKYKFQKPISINTADIDVSSNRYNSKRYERPQVPSPRSSTTTTTATPKTPERIPSFKEASDEEDSEGIFMPRIDKNFRSTIKRERTVVRLHTIHNLDQILDDKIQADESPPKRERRLEEDKKIETVKIFDEEIKKTVPKWRENFDPDELKPNRRRVVQKPLSEKYVEKFLIKDNKQEEFEDLSKVIRDDEKYYEQVDEEEVVTPVILRRNSVKQNVPSFHDICKTISSEKIDEDLNPGNNQIVRRNTRKLSNYDVMKAIRRNSAEVNGEEIKMLDELIKEEKLDTKINTEIPKPENEPQEEADVKKRKKFTKKKSNEKLVEEEPKEEKTTPQRRKIVKKKTTGSLEKAIEAITPKDTTVNEETKRTVNKISGTVEVENKPNLKLVIDTIHVEETIKSSSSPTSKKFKYNVIVEEVVTPSVEKKEIKFDAKIEVQNDSGKKQLNKMTSKLKTEEESLKSTVDKAEQEKQKMLDKILGKKPDDTQEVKKQQQEHNNMFDKMSNKKESSTSEYSMKTDKQKQQTLDNILTKKSEQLEETKKIAEETTKAKEIENKVLVSKTIEEQKKIDTKQQLSKAEEEKQKMLDKIMGKLEQDKKAELEKQKMLDKVMGKSEQDKKAEEEKQKMLDKIMCKKDDTDKKAEEEKNKMLDKILEKKDTKAEQDKKAEEEKQKMLDKIMGKNDETDKKAEEEKQKMLDKVMGRKVEIDKKPEEEKKCMVNNLMGSKSVETIKNKEQVENKLADKDTITNKSSNKISTKLEESKLPKQIEQKNKINEIQNKSNSKLNFFSKPQPKKEPVQELSKSSSGTKRNPLQKQDSVEDFWEVIGKRETIYYKNRQKYLDEKRENEKKNICWTPEWVDENQNEHPYAINAECLEKSRASEARLRQKLAEMESVDSVDKPDEKIVQLLNSTEKLNTTEKSKISDDIFKQKQAENSEKIKALQETIAQKKLIIAEKSKAIQPKLTQVEPGIKMQAIKQEAKIEVVPKKMEPVPIVEKKPELILKKIEAVQSKVAPKKSETITLVEKKPETIPKKVEAVESKVVPKKIDTAIKVEKKPELQKSKTTEVASKTKEGKLQQSKTSTTLATKQKDKIQKTETQNLQKVQTPDEADEPRRPPKLSVKQKSLEKIEVKIRPRLQRQSKSLDHPQKEKIKLTPLEIAEMKAIVRDLRIEPLKPELDFIIKEEFDPCLKPNEDLLVPTPSVYKKIKPELDERDRKKRGESPPKEEEIKQDEEKSKGNFVPLQANFLPVPEAKPKPKPKPKWFDECPVVIMATPRDLRKRNPVHRRKPEPTPAPKVTYVSDSDEDEDTSSDEESTTSSSSSGGSDEFETNIVFDANNPGANKWKSTSSNDSGFDSSAPGSPANKRNRNEDCDVNCHKKCEKLTANLCGVNQKLIVEALSSVKKGSTSMSTSSSEAPSLPPAQNPAFTLEPMEMSSAYTAYQRSGRVTPPATSIPRFRKYAVEDFVFLKVLGKGSFGKVLLAELRNTEYYYAVKCLKKDIVLEDDDVECTLIERKVLALGTKHPYLCHLFCTFQTDSHLFFVMEYLNGGDLMFHIQVSGRFPEPRGKFYGAEIVSGLKFLHSKGIVYRDLKLDNILLDFDGHVRIADFGMCKLQIFLDRTADTFCGTPDYMAPEIIKGQHYNQGVDWWSFGVLLYEMLIGQSPFSGCDEDELFWSICNERPVIPAFLSKEASQILLLLLEKDSSKRLGNKYCAAGDIKDQPFFRDIDWIQLEARQLEPPFKPKVQHPLDTQYFDKAFTAEKVKLTPIEKDILHSMDQTQFHGFSYTNPNATDK